MYGSLDVKSPADLFTGNASQMTGFGAGKQASVMTSAPDSLFAANAAGVTQPRSFLDTLASSVFDRKAERGDAPAKPRSSMLKSMGISFRTASNVKSYQRSGDRKITDLNQGKQVMQSARADMEQQKGAARASFNNMRNAAVAVMQNQAKLDGHKPDAYLPKESPGRDGFKTDSLLGAVVGTKAGLVGLVVAAAGTVSEISQEASSPPVDVATSKAGRKKIEDEIRSRGSKSQVQMQRDKSVRAGSFSGGKQDVAKDALGQEAARSGLSEEFYNSQGYKDLENVVRDGHSLEDIVQADFDSQTEVVELDSVMGEVDNVLNNYAQLEQGTGVRPNLEAMIERGALSGTDLLASVAIVEQSVKGVERFNASGFILPPDVAEELERSKPSPEFKPPEALQNLALSAPAMIN